MGQIYDVEAPPELGTLRLRVRFRLTLRLRAKPLSLPAGARASGRQQVAGKLSLCPRQINNKCPPFVWSLLPEIPLNG